MTSNRNPLQDFVLTPQQQNLLFAALNSNKPASNSPGNQVLNLSPTSYTQSPLQVSDANNFQESPYLDFDSSFDGLPNDSFDFAFDGATEPRMIGDLPGATTASHEDSASPENDSPDKRSHPDDDDDVEENGAKRRESTEKVAKKPGRKPLTSEPTSKRKAQNRAAQRAFRERKEKHLKDLETKVAELEKVSEATNHENGLLRAQVDKMTVELNEYKKRLSQASGGTRAPMPPSGSPFGAPMFSNISDVNFQFEFPKFGQLPGPPTAAVPLSTSKSPSFDGGAKRQTSVRSQSKDTNSPGSSGYTSGLDAQTKEDLAKFSGIFTPPLTNSNVASASRSSMDSHFSVNGTATSSPSASSNSNIGPSSSCGTSPEPFTQSPVGFKPVDTLTTIGEEQTNPISGNQDLGQFANIDFNDMSFVAPQGGFQFDPQLFGDYRESQDSILASGGLDDSFFNDAFNMDFTMPYNTALSPAVPKKDLIAEIDAAKESDVVDPVGFLTCNKIWEKLQNCPKVQSGDFDLDGLCSDLQKKAKCSGSGAVVDEKDFKNVMTKYLGKDSRECQGSIVANPSTT